MRSFSTLSFHSFSKVIMMSMTLAVIFSPVPSPVEAAGPVNPIPPLPVKGSIEYDEYGIPTCTASDMRSMFFLDGYVNARDRFFQMDYMRKLGSGRLAEIYGIFALPFDIILRDFEFDRAADSLLAGSDERALKCMEGSVNGVNWYLEQIKFGLEPLPPEYEDIGMEPEEIEPWTLHDTALISTLFLFGLSDPFSEEFMFGLPYYFFSDDLYHDLVRFAPIESTVIAEGFFPVDQTESSGKQSKSVNERVKIPEGFDKEKAGELLLGLKKRWEKLSELPYFPKGGGEWSNNWVVSGALTESGYPILCNDPHLEAVNPSFVYLKRLRSPMHDLTGASFSGVPGVFTGHSDRCAVGTTALSPDVIDLYFEFIPDRKHVLFEGGLVKMEITPQRYMARVMGGLQDVTWMVLDPNTYFVPHHGPVILRGILGMTGLSMKWNGYARSTDMNFFFSLIGSRNFDEAENSFRFRHTAGLNEIYADVDGNIMYSCKTGLPERRWLSSWPPFLVIPGQGGFEWDGVQDPEKLPTMVNPEKGYIATANNEPFGGSLDNDPFNDPIYIGASYRPAFRAARISGLIEEKAADHLLTVQDMFDIQADVHSLVVDAFLPFLIDAAATQEMSPEAAGALEMLENWDRFSTLDSPEASIFQTWLHKAVVLTFTDDLSFFEWSLLDDELAMKGLYYLLAHPDESATGDDLFDIVGTPETETPDDILIMALEETVDRLTERFGTSDQSQWKWGDLHKTIFPHPLGGKYDVPPPGSPQEDGYPADGTMYSVDVAMVGVKDDDFSFSHVPVTRIVTELLPDGPRSWAVSQCGQSGVLGDEHYTDMVPLWLDNEYVEMAQ